MKRAAAAAVGDAITPPHKMRDSPSGSPISETRKAPEVIGHSPAIDIELASGSSLAEETCLYAVRTRIDEYFMVEYTKRATRSEAQHM